MREVCADVVCGRALDLSQFADASAWRALCDVAAQERVLPLLEWHLRRSPIWADVPDDVRAKLADDVRSDVAAALFREREIRRIATALTAAGIDGLLLKGNALAYWLYPAPYLRECGDIDLLLRSREEALRSAKTFETLGYTLAYEPAASHFEMPCRLLVGETIQSELDLHFRLLNSAAYGSLFGFDELWLRAVDVPASGSALKMLSPAHAFANACLNRAIDLQNGLPDRLRLLYDIHLMLNRMGDDDRAEIAEMARAKGISGICLRSIEDTIKTLGTSVPRAWIERCATDAAAEPIDRQRIDDWRYMQWQNLKALPDLRARLRWLRERVLPTRSHLQARYGEGHWVSLWVKHLGRGLMRFSIRTKKT